MVACHKLYGWLVPVEHGPLEAAALPLNGERRQHAPVTDMIFPLDVIIEFISAVMTLEPGDVIATGTPAGVGPLAPGDTVEVEIEGIGTLRNTVKPVS